jgi:uncharacterized protein (DUF2252 family)
MVHRPREGADGGRAQQAMTPVRTVPPPGGTWTEGPASEPPAGASAGALTEAERRARGKAVRTRLPRSAHARYEPAPGRPDPIEALERQAASRVGELVPIRYGRMLASPFSFFRGAALIMAHDLGAAPHTGLHTQLCGDAHLSNFGLFASPERRLVFDLNDFDETLPGPWEWDVKRLAASLVVAARDNGFRSRDRRDLVLDCVRAYRTAMRSFAAMGHLDVWYAHVDAEQVQARFAAGLAASRQARLGRALTRARGRDNLQALRKLTHRVGAQRRILADPPLVVPIGDLLPGLEREVLEERLRALLRDYRDTLAPHRSALLDQYRVVDIARKAVGVGSVGTRAWILLLLGRDDSDPLLLQAKEAQPSVLTGFAGPSRYQHEGQRVVAGQLLMQAVSDIFLGWHRVDGIDGRQRDFYMRQLRDGKGSAVVETMSVGLLRRYGELCGETLARAHARSGDRFAIAAYLGAGDAFDRALAGFAEAYADQNERDHRALVTAVRTGRVRAQTGC